MPLALAVVWMAGVAMGTRTLLIYENTPAKAADSPLQWPVRSALHHSTGRYTLVMLAHPNCPCTRASVAELEIIMARLQDKITAVVLFSKPGTTETEMMESALWKKTASIPGVSLKMDPEGVESSLFGGEISGQTMLYDSEGKLIFSGGLTTARGHQGDNEGADAIVRLVTRGDSMPHHAPVFGCALKNPNAGALKEGKPWAK